MSSSSSSSRQHPHLPPHLSSSVASPAVPIEPSDSRHQAYSFSQNVGGRRGSTDPLLHASLAATATSNAHGANGSPGPSMSDSPFGTSRKRSAASAMLDAANSAPGAGNGNPHGPEGSSSPSFANGSSSRFAMGTRSPGAASMRGTGADGGPPNTLPRLSGPDSNNDRRPSISALTGYNFGTWEQSPSGSFPASGPPAPPSSAQGSAPAPPSSDSPRTNPGPAYFNGLPTHPASHHGMPGKPAYAGTVPAPPGAPGSAASHLSPPDAGEKKSALPYARSPELRVSHKLAERQRRKEMKELFDDLKELLPNLEQDKDKGKISKWEVLSKAIDHIHTINSTQNILIAEVSRTRSELGLPPWNPPPPPQRTSSERGGGSNDSDTNGPGSKKESDANGDSHE